MNLVSAADFTALDYAAKGLELPIATLLHGRGARMGDISSVMSFVADQGNAAMAKIVLAHDPPLDTLDGNGAGPLHYAALKGHVELAALLLGKGANVDFPSGGGKTALTMATKLGHEAFVALLKKHGASGD